MSQSIGSVAVMALLLGACSGDEGEGDPSATETESGAVTTDGPDEVGSGTAGSTPDDTAGTADTTETVDTTDTAGGPDVAAWVDACEILETSGAVDLLTDPTVVDSTPADESESLCGAIDDDQVHYLQLTVGPAEDLRFYTALAGGVQGARWDEQLGDGESVVVVHSSGRWNGTAAASSGDYAFLLEFAISLDTEADSEDEFRSAVNSVIDQLASR